MKIQLLPLLLVAVLGASGLSAAAAKATDNPSAQIDQILAKAWKDAKVEGNPMASDEVFLRRIYLDAAGRIPTLDEAREFLDSKDRNKRARLIEQLLDSESYVNHYFNYWADILRINTQQGGGRNITPYYAKWVREGLENNKPYDQFVRELVTAKGQPADNGAIGYTYRDRGMPLDHMANTVRVFLGTRLECAQCHNHPFDKWTQMDFYNMAAFSYGMTAGNYRGEGYTQLSRKIREMAGDDRDVQRNYQRAFQEISRPIRNTVNVSYRDDRLPQLPHDYQYSDAEPKQKIEAATMFGDEIQIGSESGRVEAYADWMTSPKNPRFTTVISNRLWKKAMGRGLIEPVDELMDSTEPSNAELMNFLEELMIESGYDMKAYLSAIFNSKAYQRQASEREVDLGIEYHFTGPVRRRMSAEQAWDSMVTLINPQPELKNWKLEQQDILRVASQKRMMTALESVPQQKMLEYTKQIAKYQKKLADETKELTEKIAKLREDGKEEEARELSREVSRTRQKITKRVEELIYEPALKKMEVELASYKLPGGEKMEMTPNMMGQNGQATQEFRKAHVAAFVEGGRTQREARDGIPPCAAVELVVEFRTAFYEEFPGLLRVIDQELGPGLKGGKKG
ncbi:MAG: DUF1549 domain-containing protein [Verrucomicrobiota bacterium]